MSSERISIQSSGEKRTARIRLSSDLASVVLPEPGSPHTMINLGPVPEISIKTLSLMNGLLCFGCRARMGVQAFNSIWFPSVCFNATLNIPWLRRSQDGTTRKLSHAWRGRFKPEQGILRAPGVATINGQG